VLYYEYEEKSKQNKSLYKERDKEAFIAAGFSGHLIGGGRRSGENL
jgi:hypothetical protein